MIGLYWIILYSLQGQSKSLAERLNVADECSRVLFDIAAGPEGGDKGAGTLPCSEEALAHANYRRHWCMALDYDSLSQIGSWLAGLSALRVSSLSLLVHAS